MRYSGLPTYYYNGKKIYLTPSFLSPSYFRSSNIQKTYYQVLAHDRLDNIAYEYYNDSSFDWIIKMANSLSLPSDLVPGMILLIPLDYKSIVAAVQNANQQGL